MRCVKSCKSILGEEGDFKMFLVMAQSKWIIAKKTFEIFVLGMHHN
jgi:hypothetical protein